ncbi:hypothetical protein ACLOJK_025210 [Asimina triloba]
MAEWRPPRASLHMRECTRLSYFAKTPTLKARANYPPNLFFQNPDVAAPDRPKFYYHARMEKYVVPRPASPPNSKSHSRSKWKISFAELNGRILPKHRHEFSALLLQSYSEGILLIATASADKAAQRMCAVISGTALLMMNRIVNGANDEVSVPQRKEGVSGLEFDNKDNRSEPSLLQLYSKAKANAISLLRIMMVSGVACASLQNNKILLFDISYVSHEPVQVLKARPSFTVHGSEIYNGFSDIAFTSFDMSRREDILVYGASKQGIIYAWDLRGGRTSVAFQSHKQVNCPPLMSMKVAQMMEKITSLKVLIEMMDARLMCIYGLLKATC